MKEKLIKCLSTKFTSILIVDIKFKLVKNDAKRLLSTSISLNDWDSCT